MGHGDVDAGVDAEGDNISPPADWLESEGVEFVHMPIRDGQLPSEAQVARFMEVVRESDGPVFVHCGVGVGRRGTMVEAYLKVAVTTASRVLDSRCASTTTSGSEPAQPRLPTRPSRDKVRKNRIPPSLVTFGPSGGSP